MPNTLCVLKNRMLCTEIPSRLPDFRVLHRVIRTNTFSHNIFKNDEERIRLQIIIYEIGTSRSSTTPPSRPECKDVPIYDEPEAHQFLERHLPPPRDEVRTASAPLQKEERLTWLEVAKYDGQARHLADRYVETRPAGFAPYTPDGYLGNRRNQSRALCATPRSDVADMIIVGGWLKHHCKTYRYVSRIPLLLGETKQETHKDCLLPLPPAPSPFNFSSRPFICSDDDDADGRIRRCVK
ncbi:hypothetical protein PG993_005536 [Apiospora rasikravindrae]|uniref:Uncharacterized protein n=1 Tax=Apiospora rasikravindrae TaxID=990691 RepID=A0ABR1TFW6_9PEZI